MAPVQREAGCCETTLRLGVDRYLAFAPRGRRASARLEGYHVVVGALAPVQESGRTVRVGILGPAGHEAFTMGVSADPVAVGDAMSTVALRAISASIDQRFRAWIGEEIRWDSIPTAGWPFA